MGYTQDAIRLLTSILQVQMMDSLAKALSKHTEYQKACDVAEECNNRLGDANQSKFVQDLFFSFDAALGICEEVGTQIAYKRGMLDALKFTDQYMFLSALEGLPWINKAIHGMELFSVPELPAKKKKASAANKEGTPDEN